MKLEQWLQLRREGRLAAMPLGMQTAMAAFGDEWPNCDMFLDGYGDGYGSQTGNGAGNGYENGSTYRCEDGNREIFKNGYGIGNGIAGRLGNSTVAISRITQRFHKVNR